LYIAPCLSGEKNAKKIPASLSLKIERVLGDPSSVPKKQGPRKFDRRTMTAGFGLKSFFKRTSESV
jgi:hypothetical protein